MINHDFRTLYNLSGEFSRGFGRQSQGRGGFSSPFDDFFKFDFHGGQQSECVVSFMEVFISII